MLDLYWKINCPSRRLHQVMDDIAAFHSAHQNMEGGFGVRRGSPDSRD